MESSIFRQIADLAREHKTAARATAVFLCLALVVTLTTVGILTHTGQAMTQKVKVLTCQLDVHQHTADCKDETGAFVCGYADYVVHLHNDDCYDENGILVCTLPQIAPHTHTAACYGEVKTPICGQEETPPHVHTEACYLREQGELTCTVQEHVHGDECFLRESVLTCDKTEDPHVHTDACYTVTRDLTCGQEEGEEHTHSDACYTENRVLTCDKTVDPHVHTDACYTVNETLICQIPEHTHTDECYAWTETLTCEIPEGQVPEGGHVHTDECFEVTKELTCGQLEKHEHTDACFVLDGAGNRTGRPICGKAELLEHVHGEDCFTIEEREAEDEPSGPAFFQLFETEDLQTICGKEEHTHDDTCLNEAGEIVCGKEEHTHDASCFPSTGDSGEESVAVAVAIPAEPDAPAYICGKTEHTHDASCLNEAGEIVCGIEEHVHEDACLAPAPEAEEAPAYVCGKIEHTHDASCLDEAGEAVCGIEEHTHDASCLTPVPAEDLGALTKTYRDASVLITVTCPEEAMIPAEAELRATQMTAGGDIGTYEQNMEDARDAVKGQMEIGQVLLYDIGFYLPDGTEIEPAAPVTVTIQFLDANGIPSGAVSVVHFGDHGTEVLDAVSDGSGIRFETGSFSPFGFFANFLDADIAVIFEGAAAANEPADLKPFLTDAKLTQNGVEVNDVVVGEHYTYTVDFAESAGQEFSSPMTFQLPENVKWEADSGNIYDTNYQGPNPVGSYSVDESGLVTFRFNQDYLTGMKNKKLSAGFDLTVTEVSEEGIEFPWGGDDQKRTFPLETAPDAKLTKVDGQYLPGDPNGPCIEYTVELEITKGMVKNPKLTDTMQEGVGLLANEDGSPIEGNEYTVQVFDGDKDITDTLDPKPTLKKTDDGWEVEGLPKEMSKGQKVVVKYKALLDFPEMKNKEEASGGVVKYKVENTADFEGDSPVQKDGKITRTADANKTVSDTRLKKNGYKDTSKYYTNNLDWEIDLGSGSGDVRSSIVHDRLTGNHWYNQKRPIEIKWKDANGVTIQTYYIPWNKAKDFGLTVSGDGKSFDLDLSAMTKAGQGYTERDEETGAVSELEKFWETKDSEGNVRKWQQGDKLRIEYYTEYDEDGAFKNSASVDADVPLGVDGVITVGAAGISKNIDFDGDDILYTVEMDIPALRDFADIIGSDEERKAAAEAETLDKVRFYLTDELVFETVKYTKEDGTEDKERYFVRNIPQIESFYVQEKDADGNLIGPVYDFQTGEGAKAPYKYKLVQMHDNTGKPKDYREFQILFNTDSTSNKESYWMIPYSSHVTLTYRIPKDAKLVQERPLYEGTPVEVDRTLAEILGQGNTLRNDITGKGGGPTELEARREYIELPQPCDVEKSARILDELVDGDAIIEYQVVFNGFHVNMLTNDYEEYGIDPTTFSLTDTFDSRLEYVEGSLNVQIYSPNEHRHRYTFWYADEKGNPRPLKITEADGKATFTAEAEDFDWREGGQDTDDATLHNYMWSNSKNEVKTRDALYVFSYQLRLKDAKDIAASTMLHNEATVTYNGENDGDDADVYFEPDLLDKEGTIVKNEDPSAPPRMHYVVKINPNALNMATGTNDAGETTDLSRFTMTDTMESILELVYGTVQVYDDKTGEALTPVGDQTLVTEDANNYVFLPLEEDNGFQLILPDQRALRIEYDAYLKVSGGDAGTVANTVTLSGGVTMAHKSEAEYDVQGSHVTITGTTALHLFKQDAVTGAVIEGAELTLYTLKDDPASIDGMELKDLLEEYDVLEPDVADGDSVGPKNEYNGYYILRETKAPGGYQLDPTPVVIRFGEPPADGPETVKFTLDDVSYEMPVKYIYGGSNAVIFKDEPETYSLPESGGSGLEPLYGVGIAMMALSAVLFLERDTRRRRGEDA